MSDYLQFPFVWLLLFIVLMIGKPLRGLKGVDSYLAVSFLLAAITFIAGVVTYYW